MASLLGLSGEPRFKVEAYERAAQVVSTLGEELAERVEEDSLRELQGIGPALSKQIQELWNTGSSARLEQLRAQHPPGAAELVRVAGMTARRIQAISAALQVASVEQLRDACTAGLVRGLPGFGAKTEAKLLAASEAALRPKATEPEPLLLSEGLVLLERLQAELAHAELASYVVGPARRGEELLDGLDLLVTDEPRACERLSRLRVVLRIERKASKVFLADGVVLRLHVATTERLGNELVRTSGSEQHVAALAERAAQRGVRLESREFRSEAELYGALELPVAPPELRGERLELTPCAFADLIQLGDVVGLVHCHTSYSDGRNSVLEMARAAHELGMRYITITDHSPSAHYAGGASIDALKRQWDEIARAQEQVPIRILRGTESDILSDGSLDYPDAILEQLDVVIASIHARHKQDRSTMTARLRRALSLPLFKVWGHALGRMLRHRDAIDCDVPELFDVLASSRGAIELNADPHRLDLPPRWIPAARERGIPFVISVDAHSTRGFAALRYGVTMARRGGLTRNEVLNTLPADEFARAVRPT